MSASGRKLTKKCVLPHFAIIFSGKVRNYFRERSGNNILCSDPMDFSITIATTVTMVSFSEGQKL